MCSLTVRYTPGQLRSLVAIPQETYRHWKKALPPILRGQSHSPCFTAGDLVATAVIRVLAIDMAIRVGRLKEISESLFDVCNRTSWPSLQRSTLLMDLAAPKLELVSEHESIGGRGPLVLIPLHSIVADLGTKLVAADPPEDQDTLRFPLTPVRSTSRRLGRDGR